MAEYRPCVSRRNVCDDQPDLVCLGGCLALLIKGHDHTDSTVAFDHPGMFLKGILPFLEGDRVDYTLALACFETSLHNVKLQVSEHCHNWLLFSTFASASCQNQNKAS